MLYCDAVRLIGMFYAIAMCGRPVAAVHRHFKPGKHTAQKLRKKYTTRLYSIWPIFRWFRNGLRCQWRAYGAMMKVRRLTAALTDSRENRRMHRSDKWLWLSPTTNVSRFIEISWAHLFIAANDLNTHSRGTDESRKAENARASAPN